MLCDHLPITNTCLSRLVQYYDPIETGLGFVTVILTLFTIFIILWHSPRELSPYKWFILNCTLWDLATVVYTSFLFEPVPLFPAYGGIIRGPLRFLGFYAGPFLFSFILIFYIMCHCSINLCFAYRHSILRPVEQRRRSRLIAIMAAMIGYSISMQGVIVYAVIQMRPNIETIIANVLEQRPIWQSEILNYTLFGFDKLSKYLFIYKAGVVCAFGGNAVISTVFFLLTRHRLNQQKKFLNAKKFRMHRALLLTLATQILLPLVSFIIPVAGIPAILSTKTTNDVLVVFILSPVFVAHPVNSIATLYFCEPYRRAAIATIKNLIPVWNCRHSAVSSHNRKSISIHSSRVRNSMY